MPILFSRKEYHIRCDAKDCMMYFRDEDNHVVGSHSRAALIVAFARDVKAGEPWAEMPDGETFYCDDGNCRGEKAWFKCSCGEWVLNEEGHDTEDGYKCDECFEPSPEHLQARSRALSAHDERET